MGKTSKLHNKKEKLNVTIIKLWHTNCNQYPKYATFPQSCWSQPSYILKYLHRKAILFLIYNTVLRTMKYVYNKIYSK